MIARVALSLAWSAALALLAYPAQAQIIGQQSGFLGGEAGFLTPTSGAATASTVTLDAMPYARTVTCGTYTLTGTYTGSAPTGWTASPSGASGSCTDLGAGSFSCVVDVNPDASGEGVETITIGTETVTIGFYVDGEHSCFLAQSVDGSYNSTVDDLDAVATWENLGSSALDVTQGTGAAQPTFRTGIVNGQPVVRCDGGDRVAASTASDWTFFHDGTDWTVEHVSGTSSANPNALYVLSSTVSALATTSVGFAIFGDDRASQPANDRSRVAIYDNSAGAAIDLVSVDNSWPSGRFSLIQAVLDDDGGAGVDASQFCNGSACGTAAQSGGYAAGDPNGPLSICALQLVSSGNTFTGDLFRVLIYQSALTATQRGINEAVDEWALGGSLPVVPPLYRLDSSESGAITTAGGSVSSWRSQGLLTVSATQGTGANQPTSTVSGSSSGVSFDGGNDSLSTTSAASPPNWHIFAVVTVDAVDTNSGTCTFDDVIHGFSLRAGLFLRSVAGVISVQAGNDDGSVDCASATITASTKTIVEGKADGTNVSVAVNGGSFTSTASGNTSATASPILVGGTTGQFFDGTIHEVVHFPDDLTSTQRDAVIADLQTKWGL